MSWLPLTSTTVAPARLDIARWASGGIILSSTAIRYELGFALHAGSLILPLRADRDYSARPLNRELVSCCFPNRSLFRLTRSTESSQLFSYRAVTYP